jgi:sterol-4alpha-carboxylate 3-dehydrogenase (decarboxylating)
VVNLVNVIGTQNVVNAAREHGCRALVYTSSCTVVTDDLNGKFPNIDERWPVSKVSSIYGESKAEAETIVLTANNTPTTEKLDQDEKVGNHDRSVGHAISTCVLRPSVIFGEGDSQLIPSIHACIQKGETRYRIGDGNNMWDTVYVGNVADAHVLAVENLLFYQPRSEESNPGVDSLECGSIESGRAAGETFFIQNNEPIPFRDFSLAVWKEFGHIPPRLEIPIPEGLGWVLGFFAEAFTRASGQATTLCRGSVRDACAMRYASGDKARKILGYRPRIGLEAGLKRSCRVSRLL